MLAPDFGIQQTNNTANINVKTNFKNESYTSNVVKHLKPQKNRCLVTFTMYGTVLSSQVSRIMLAFQ